MVETAPFLNAGSDDNRVIGLDASGTSVKFLDARDSSGDVVPISKVSNYIYSF